MEVEKVNRVCVRCGKVFQEVKHPKGNKRKFCSDVCKTAHRQEYRRDYFRKRYAEDEEYREKLCKNNAKYIVERRRIDKENALREAIVDLYNAETMEDIKRILEERFNMKAELYDKYAHALRR